jgi:DNA-binding transcriptional regulator YiaG
MQLKDYLRLERESAKDFAKRAGVTVHAVRKWIRKERMPRPHKIVKIKLVTKGAVTESDWLPKD